MIKYYNSSALCAKIHEAPDFIEKSAIAGFPAGWRRCGVKRIGEP